MIVCSVVTLPTRVDSLKIVLENIQSQTLKPDILYITVCDYYPRLKVSFSENMIEDLQKFTEKLTYKTQIIRMPIDIGPVLKLIAPLSQGHDNDDIVILDDDSPLYFQAIEKFMECKEKYGKGVYGLMGVIQKNFVHGEWLEKDVHEVEVLGGYRGVLYPMSFIDRDKLEKFVFDIVEEHEKRGTILLHDDHVFSYFLQMNGLSKYVCRIPKRSESSHWRDQLHYDPIDNTDGIMSNENALSMSIIEEYVKTKQ